MYKKAINASKLEIILSLIAIIICGAIFLKAIIDVDTNYDVGWYHLPFAARIWGIIPESSFSSENLVEYRFNGFPLLAHFFQGLFWKVTGRVQATNLVGYFSLIVYLFFLRSYFQVPLYLSAIAILAIPAVLTHAATSFVDLPGNIGVAVVVMMIYRFFTKTTLPSRKELLAAFLGAIMAANTKPQLTVLIALLWWIVAIRLIWLYISTKTKPSAKSNQRKTIFTLILTAIASGLIFVTPIKNVALYGNPVYPIKVEVAGIVLNHRTTPKTYSEGNRPQKWLRSVLEVNTPEWTADQYNYSGNPELLDRAGGFFGAYVMFNLLLLLGLTIREQLLNRTSDDNKSRNATTAFIIVLAASVFVANFPQSHELRYFMFWMISLVSLNLSLVAILSQNQIISWLKSKYLGLCCLLFLSIVCTRVENSYLKPSFISPQAYMKDAVNWKLLDQTLPNKRVCMIARHAIPDLKTVPFASIANAIFYSSYFHPEINYDYSIKAAIDPKDCGNLTIIPQGFKPTS
ncbi:MAG: hypothetical protein RLZZ171_2976 [Cyanobacteriota bacterium]|jgi:hypothetical protein